MSKSLLRKEAVLSRSQLLRKVTLPRVLRRKVLPMSKSLLMKEVVLYQFKLMWEVT